jgi:hypothetical protein
MDVAPMPPHRHPTDTGGIRSQEFAVFSPLAILVTQHAAADRRHRFVAAARRSRLDREPIAPDLIRTVDLGVLPTAPLGSTVRMDDALAV